MEHFAFILTETVLGRVLFLASLLVIAKENVTYWMLGIGLWVILFAIAHRYIATGRHLPHIHARAYEKSVDRFLSDVGVEIVAKHNAGLL